MGQLLTDLSFEAWIAYVFDHPVQEPAWYWDIDQDHWDASGQAALTVAYVTRLFSDPVPALEGYSDEQLKQGLWFLVDNACSDHLLTLRDTAVPVADRIACIQAMYHLFDKLFAVRCTAALGHRSESGNPLNSICYMWWDLLPLSSNASHDTHFVEQLNLSETIKALWKADILRIDLDDYRQIVQACLLVMPQILDLDSDACRESALHGLGHWSLHHRELVQEVIDAWLKRHSSIRTELKAYAQYAKAGCIQ